MRALLAYIRKFGFWRGIEFHRVALLCEQDRSQLRTWSNHFRARASDAFYHDHPEKGRSYLAFAEILRSTYDTLVLNRKPQRPLLTRQMRQNRRHSLRKTARRP